MDVTTVMQWVIEFNNGDNDVLDKSALHKCKTHVKWESTLKMQSKWSQLFGNIVFSYLHMAE